MKNLLTITALALTTACASIHPNIRTDFNKARDILYLAEYRDTHQTPYKTETTGKGNCLDKAVYLKYLLENDGYKSRVRVGTYRDSPPHAWLEMDYKGKILILDPTTDFFDEDKKGEYNDLTEFYLNLKRKYPQ